MNKWTEKSFKISYEKGYLDNLHNIYPMLDNKTRELDLTIKNKLKIAFEKKDNELLLKTLLRLNKFPIKDSYKPFFTRCKSNELDIIIKSNPKTVERIANRIYSLGFDKMIAGIEEPIETNRQMGQMFPNWIKEQYKSYTNHDLFFDSKESISVLSGGDASLVKFVKKYLNVILPKGTGGDEKGLDLVIKLNNKSTPIFIIGEAKFLSDEGGHQNAQLKDALHLITSSEFKNNGDFKVIRIAILDGVCWLSSERKMQRDLKGLSDNHIAISALLLDDFFKSFIK